MTIAILIAALVGLGLLYLSCLQQKVAEDIEIKQLKKNNDIREKQIEIAASTSTDDPREWMRDGKL